MTGVPSVWIPLFSILSPTIIAAMLTCCWLICSKRSLRSDIMPEPRSTQVYIFTTIVGVFLGSISQWCLHEVIVSATGVPASELKLLLFGALITGPLSMIMYTALRWWAKKSSPGLYEFLTVRWPRTADSLNISGDPSDMTVRSGNEK